MARKTRERREKARVAYANFGDGPDKVKLADLDEAVREGAVVIALSEHSDRIDVTNQFLKKHPEWKRWYGDGRVGAAKECLLYHESLGKTTLERTHTLVGARRLAPGAGPENASPKCINRVRIRRPKGSRRRTLHLIVGHQYATVNNRKEAAWLFMHALINVLRGLRGVVIFFGDLNATPSHALVKALRALFTGSSAPKSGPTHHRRLIDYIMVRGTRILEAFTKKISSGHKMVFVDILL